VYNLSLTEHQRQIYLFTHLNPIKINLINHLETEILFALLFPERDSTGNGLDQDEQELEELAASDDFKGIKLVTNSQQ